MLGVVLAGGSSRRMGRDKAMVEVAGHPMINWVVEALESVCDRVLISGRSDGWEGREVLPDEPDSKGPLAGLVPALQLGEPLLFVAVDQPWVRTSTLRKLAGVGVNAVPLHDGSRQVTCACYYPDLAMEATIEAARGGSVQSLLDRVPVLEITEGVWSSWGEDGRSWFSVDSPEDIDEGLKRYGPPK